MVNLLIEAAEIMNPIYLRQRSVDNRPFAPRCARSRHPQKAALLDMFDLHSGRGIRSPRTIPFYGGEAMPAGAGFYPKDLTKADFDAIWPPIRGQKEALTSGISVVKRQVDRLVAVPYSVGISAMAGAGGEAARAGGGPASKASLRKFLKTSEPGLSHQRLLRSELPGWTSRNPDRGRDRPYEVYTEPLYGTETAFEAFITVQDPGESAALTKYKALLPDMERNLPVEDRYKNFDRPFASPILVADQVHGGGDNVPGVQTIAFNLPNDERVREAKGAKKVILANVLGAKYERILAPIGGA